MVVPGGSRPEDQNETPEKYVRHAEILDEEQELEDSTESSECLAPRGIPPRRNSLHDRGDGERIPRKGIWLGTDMGLMVFHPVLSPNGPSESSPPTEDSVVQDADEASLDVACWLMPLLPREHIAETLKLGAYRERPDA